MSDVVIGLGWLAACKLIRLKIGHVINLRSLSPLYADLLLYLYHLDLGNFVLTLYESQDIDGKRFKNA